MKKILVVTALLTCLAGCTLREVLPLDKGARTVMVKIGIGASSRSSFFDCNKESLIDCFVLAAYREGFLASTMYFDSGKGDFEASADINCPILVNSGFDYTFYVLANFGNISTENPFPPYEKDVAGIIVRPGLAGGFLPMAGKGTLDLSSGTVNIEMKHLVAKISCNVTLPYGAVLEDARLCQAPAASRPFGIAYSARPDEVRDGDSFAFTTNADSGYQSGPSGMQGYTLSSEALYVLENMQGEESGNTDVWKKYPSDDVRAASATYIRMYVIFPDGPMEMRFYLGSDALCNYDLERNSCYTMNVAIWDSDATKSGWSMVDLRCTDNWPGEDFLAGQVRSISFRSSDVLLSPQDGSDDVIGLDTDGHGNWFISGLGAGDADIDVIAEDIVRWTIQVSVKPLQGTTGELQLGLHGNASGIFEAGVTVGDRKLWTTETPVLDMPDDPSLLCADVLRSILYGQDGVILPQLVPTGEVPEGVVKSSSANPSYPDRPDSLFVYDPSNWESRYGAGILFEHAFSISAGDITLDIPVRISNALCTPDKDSVMIVFHDWSLSAAHCNDVNSLSWNPYPQGCAMPVPSPDQLNIVSVPITDTLDANGAMNYLYVVDNTTFSVIADLNPSTSVSHTVGLIEIYADVVNSRSGAVYRTPLFKEGNYMHLSCGAMRSYSGKAMTGGQGKYNYETDRIKVYAELSAPISNLPKRNRAVEKLFYTPGIVLFTDSTYILYPWGGCLEPAYLSRPYCFVARHQHYGDGSISSAVYYDLFWENEHVECNEPSEYYYLTGDTELPEREPAYDLDTEKTSQLFGGWLVLHKYQELDGSTHGWVDVDGVNFPINPHKT